MPSVALTVNRNKNNGCECSLCLKNVWQAQAPHYFDLAIIPVFPTICVEQKIIVQ
jgi:hypothetical protein